MELRLSCTSPSTCISYHDWNIADGYLVSWQKCNRFNWDWVASWPVIFFLWGPWHSTGIPSVACCLSLDSVVHEFPHFFSTIVWYSTSFSCPVYDVHSDIYCFISKTWGNNSFVIEWSGISWSSCNGLNSRYQQMLCDISSSHAPSSASLEPWVWQGLWMRPKGIVPLKLHKNTPLWLVLLMWCQGLSPDYKICAKRPGVQQAWFCW